MINIVIPMAGAGSRFTVAGYTDPKPLIPIKGIPMIQMVIHNLTPNIEHRFIFICQKTHVKTYKLDEKLPHWAPGCTIIELEGVTEGAACTVLAASPIINNNEALMIANSDQYIDMNINDYLQYMSVAELDGLIMTMTAHDPKWSFVGIDKKNGKKERVTQVVEKKVISNEATVGIYNFRKGRDFVEAAHHMIAENLRVNNEFYVAPTYNQLIQNGQQIGIFNIGKETDGMYGLGTPADLCYFINAPIHKKAIAGLCVYP